MRAHQALAAALFVALSNGADAGEAAVSGGLTFRSDLWPAAAIRREKRRTVRFYTTAGDALHDDCLGRSRDEVAAFFTDKASRLSVGERCDKLFVLVHHTQGAMSDTTREFVGAHETYHLVAQIFSGAAPGALLEPRPKITPGSDKFFDDLAAALTPHPGTGDTQAIADIAGRYAALSAQDRAVVDFMATIEWPAEYYAYLVMADEKRGWGIERYREVRKEASDETGYRAAIPVGLALDRRLGAGRWQERVLQGENMFAILAGLAGVSVGSRAESVNVTRYALSL